MFDNIIFFMFILFYTFLICYFIYYLPKYRINFLYKILLLITILIVTTLFVLYNNNYFDNDKADLYNKKNIYIVFKIKQNNKIILTNKNTKLNLLYFNNKSENNFNIDDYFKNIFNKKMIDFNPQLSGPYLVDEDTIIFYVLLDTKKNKLIEKDNRTKYIKYFDVLKIKNDYENDNFDKYDQDIYHLLFNTPLKDIL